MSRISVCLIVVAGVCVTAACGGSSAPAAPSTTTTTTTTTSATAPVIVSVVPAVIVASAFPQAVTVTGTNFQAGLTLTVTPTGAAATTYSGAQIQSLSPTSFQVSATFPGAAAYSFQVTLLTGEKSNALSSSVSDSRPPWTAEGIRLQKSDSSIADSSSFRLKDGRWRMLISYFGGIRSYVSPDGLSLTAESGVRIANPSQCGHVRALRLDDGRIKVFCRNPQGIVSAISSDEGLTFTIDNTLLISNASVGASLLSTGGIVRTRDGRWRMYFSDEYTGFTQPPGKIFSAVSTDLQNWSVEPGVRIGAGATASGDATHPAAIVNPDGSTSVYYSHFSLTSVPPSSTVWVATSNDGLTFTSDVTTGLTPGADPDIVPLSGGSLRLYYNWGDNVQGTVYSAQRAAGSPPAFEAAVPRSFAAPLEKSFRPVR